MKEFEKYLNNVGFDLSVNYMHGKALDQNQALEAVDILKRNRIPIGGGDVYIYKNNEMEYAYTPWSCNRRDFNSYEEYLIASWEKAKKYIYLFKDKKRKKYYHQIYPCEPTGELKCKWIPGKEGSKGQCVYYEKESYVEYIECQNEEKKTAPYPKFRDIIDASFGLEQKKIYNVEVGSLTIIFADEEKGFKTLKAKTNKSSWQEVSHKIPPILTEEGDLIVEIFPYKENFYKLELSPRYEYSKTENFLKIILASPPPQEYYKIAENLAVGLTKGTLKEILMLNIQIR